MNLDSATTWATTWGTLARSFALATTLCLGFALATPATVSAETRMGATYETTVEAEAIEVGSNLDMRDDGYNSEYIFGMTKGVANSTMVPAIKPLFFLVTVPLDLAFLPFAAIGGFF